jgi:hypothetical protein
MKTPRPSLRLLPAIFAILATATQLATGAQVTLAPSKDNSLIQVTSTSAAQLSNGLGDIFVGRTNQDGQGPATISKRRGLMAFDVAGSAIPAGATITSVTLTMRDVMGLNGDRNVTLHRTSADWGEGTSFQSGGMGASATTGDTTWFYRFYDATTPAASTPWRRLRTDGQRRVDRLRRPRRRAVIYLVERDESGNDRRHPVLAREPRLKLRLDDDWR